MPTVTELFTKIVSGVLEVDVDHHREVGEKFIELAKK
jgi:hypothetical protein